MWLSFVRGVHACVCVRGCSVISPGLRCLMAQGPANQMPKKEIQTAREGVEEEEEEIYICSSRLGLIKMDHHH